MGAVRVSVLVNCYWGRYKRFLRWRCSFLRAVGEVKRVDSLGRVVIPKRLRREFGISLGTPVEFLVGDGGVIVLRKWSPRCALCGSTADVVPFRGRHVCPACAGEAARAAAAGPPS
ncbi:MAG: AbrB/MazE/SpoVT family DNA-binding domain-containing protein [Moorellaceae bacterium]